MNADVEVLSTPYGGDVGSLSDCKENTNVYRIRPPFYMSQLFFVKCFLILFIKYLLEINC
jgi:hypothetical protein